MAIKLLLNREKILDYLKNPDIKAYPMSIKHEALDYAYLIHFALQHMSANEFDEVMEDIKGLIKVESFGLDTVIGLI